MMNQWTQSTWRYFDFDEKLLGAKSGNNTLHLNLFQEKGLTLAIMSVLALNSGLKDMAIPLITLVHLHSAPSHSAILWLSRKKLQE